MRCTLAYLLGGLVSAETLVVGPSGPFTSIQQAIAHARAGDTVRVEAGVYLGNVLVDRALILEGIGRPVIRGDGRTSVVAMTAPHCTVRGFVIEHSGPMLVNEDAGVLLKSSGNRIENNELRDVLFGVYFYQSNDNVVSNNVIRGRDWLEMGERGSAIHIWDSLRNTITYNVITGARDGMYLQNASQSFIGRNRVQGLRYGLHYMFSDDNRFEDNQFIDNVAGAAIMYSRRIQFRRNAFVHNRGFSSFGILFQDSHNCIAEENDISDNATGVFMEALTASVFRRNTISANDVAIQAFSSATGVTFASNNFVENLSPLELIGRELDTQWSENGRGNYWSAYDGYDLDGDGLGDFPFRIQNVFQHLESNYPRLRVFLFSPAAQALAVSGRMFPIIEGPPVSDPHPLMKPLNLPRAATAAQHAGASGPGLALFAALIVFSLLLAGVGRRHRWSKYRA